MIPPHTSSIEDKYRAAALEVSSASCGLRAWRGRAVEMTHSRLFQNNSQRTALIQQTYLVLNHLNVLVVKFLDIMCRS